jgi:phosphatidylinositol alpha-1,6-mannosyltransferase
VIIITTQCFYPKIGGIEALMTSLANEMSIRYSDVLVLADGLNNKKDNSYKFKIKRFKGWKPIRRLNKSKLIKKICNDQKVEAIYADSWKSIEYLNNITVPIFVLAHGTEIQKKFNPINLYKNFKQLRIISSYKKANKIVANSSYTKELLIESLLINKEKIAIIHPGIDVYNKFIKKHTLEKIKNIIGNSSPVILTLARLEARKGHKLILTALSALLEKYPNLLYVIAGDGPNKFNLKKQAKELGLENNIRFLGWVTEPEKSVLLKNINVFAMTPYLEKESVEGFGMAFIDAAFHGVPVLGTDSGGISDAIVDGQTGLIAKTSNQKDITNKIDQLLSNEELRLNLGEGGRKNALSRFTWEHKIREYLSLLKD